MNYLVGKARGLMETRDLGYRGKRCREGLNSFALIRLGPAGSCSRSFITLASEPATLPTNFKQLETE